MASILSKYAQLLVNYCVSVQPGERVYVHSTTLAEPLVREVYREVLRAGGLPHIQLDMRDQSTIRLQESNDDQLAHVNPLYAQAMTEFEAYIYIRAPFYSRATQTTPEGAAKKSGEAHRPYRQRYSERTATLELKRTLCEYPTMAHAQNAGLSLEEYAEFIYQACHLYADHPQAEWEAVSQQQQHIVDHLNQCEHIRYLGEDIDIEFSTKGRSWINSDGKTNMPSGEVYTAPVDDSVNGTIHFSYPSIFRGEEVEGITLWVKDGWVERWEAKKGKDLLDRIFNIDEGARRFGEAAIGTNYRIQTPVKNILFDEKIGGSVHMAVGQAYLQNGGTNHSAIHWDMIANMKNGGQIFADDQLIYESGKFLL